MLDMGWSSTTSLPLTEGFRMDSYSKGDSDIFTIAGKKFKSVGFMNKEDQPIVFSEMKVKHGKNIS